MKDILFAERKNPDKKPPKKSKSKKHKRFLKPGKLLKLLVQLFSVFILHSMVNLSVIPATQIPENKVPYTAQLPHTARLLKFSQLRILCKYTVSELCYKALPLVQQTMNICLQG